MWTIGNNWDKVLNEEFNKEYFVKLKKIVEKEYENYKIYPSKKDIFNALKLVDYNDVRVVLLGQDPYYSTDFNENKHAHGLSFSSLSIYQIPPSLKNIYKELENDIEDFIRPMHGNLSKWARQGVLLLNSVLTVRAGNAKSHSLIGWEKFTNHILSLLGNSEKPMIFILFGALAQQGDSYESH